MPERGRSQLLADLDDVERRENTVRDEIEKLDEDLAWLERDRAMYEGVLQRIRFVTARKADAETLLEAIEKERRQVEDALADVWDAADPPDAPDLPRAA